MAPRTRYFLIGSSLVVVVGLCTGLVAYYSGALPGGALRRAEFAYLPADASAVGYADVADIMDSEFRQQLRDLLPAGADKARFQEETGIDIERDIDTVFVAIGGASPAAGATLVVVKGRFDAAKIEGLAAQHGAVAESYRDIRMLVAPPTAAGSDHLGGTPGIAFLESGMLALGSRESIRQAIDAAASGGGAGQDAELMQAVTGIERNGNAWFVARTSVMADHADLPDVVQQQLDGVRWVALGANVDRGVHTLVRAEARDEQAAQDLRGVLNGLISAARLMSNRDARFESALASIQTSGSGSTVELEFTLPIEFLGLVRELGPWRQAPTTP